MKYDVFGLGNPLIDVIIHSSDKLLDDLGIVKGSMNLVDAQTQQRILKETHAQKWVTALGGSCANSMVMLAQLGGKSAYLGNLGDDDLGADYEAQLVDAGVTSFLNRESGPTGSTVILVTPDADRTMNTHLGNCQNLSKESIPFEAIGRSRYIYIEGYLWDTPSQKQTVLTAIEHAKKQGIKIAFTLSDCFCVQRHKEEFLNLIEKYVDLLFCNEIEAAEIVEGSSPQEHLDNLAKIVPHLILTMGTQGSLIKNGSEQVKVDAFEIKAIDTTGAGDSFAAGYLYGITQGYSTQSAGKLASYCASVIVSQDGPRFQGDLRAKVSEYLR